MVTTVVSCCVLHDRLICVGVKEREGGGGMSERKQERERE